VATAIPSITDDFHSLDQVGWYGSAFFLTVAAFQATWGKAYKYFHLKRTFLLAIFIFELGSLICAVAKNSTTLIVGRAIAGMGGAGIASGAYTILAFSAPPKQAAAFTGILGAVYAVASVVGPLLGGVFTDNLSWRWCFYINLPIGGAAAILIVFFFQTPHAAKPQKATPLEKFLQMDLVGTFVLMAAMVCLILALQWGGTTKPWGSADVIGVLVGFVLIIILFIGIEIWLDDRALIVPRLMKQRTMTLLALYQTFGSGVFLMFLYYLPIYFQVVSGVTAAQSGIRNLPYILGIALMTIVSGVTITITGHYIHLLVIGAALGTVGSGLLFTLDVGSSSSKWIGYQAVAGIGFGLGIQIAIIVSQAIVAKADISSITAIMIFFQTISGAIFVSIGQTLFTNQLIKSVPKYAPNVDPATVVATGATQLKDTFSAADLPGVIRAYMSGLKDAYALGIALAGCAFVVSLLFVVFDRKKLNHDQKEAAGAGAA
jgi:MFS transporter, DHA2 family, glioxin efflux transporter